MSANRDVGGDAERPGDAVTSWARASQFAAQFGDGRAGLRLRARVDSEARRALVAQLEAEGGSHSAHPRASVGTEAERSPLAAALETLTELADLRALESPAAESSVRRLEKLQSPQGSWGEGSERARIVRTGIVAGLLARTFAARVSILDRAARFLAEHWDRSLVHGGEPGMLLAFAPFFASFAHELSDEALQWCGRELERGLRTGRIRALAAARVLTLADALVLPGGRTDAGCLLPGLRAAQADDGGWEYGPGGGTVLRVAATLDAALALVRFGAVRVVSRASEEPDEKPRSDP